MSLAVAPKKMTELEIVSQTLDVQNQQSEALKKIVNAMIGTEERMSHLAEETSERLDHIENSITLNDSECTQLQREAMFKATELTKECLKEEVSSDYYSAKYGQFIRLVYKRIKTRFNVHKYTLVKHVEFNKAIQFVKDIKFNDFSDKETRETKRQSELREKK